MNDGGFLSLFPRLSNAEAFGLMSDPSCQAKMSVFEDLGMRVNCQLSLSRKLHCVALLLNSLGLKSAENKSNL